MFFVKPMNTFYLIFLILLMLCRCSQWLHYMDEEVKAQRGRGVCRPATWSWSPDLQPCGLARRTSPLGSAASCMYICCLELKPEFSSPKRWKQPVRVAYGSSPVICLVLSRAFWVPGSCLALLTDEPALCRCFGWSQCPFLFTETLFHLHVC